jgi:hypothetical protein
VTVRRSTKIPSARRRCIFVCLVRQRDEQVPTRSRPHCIKSADHFAQQCATKAALKHQPMPVKGPPSCSRHKQLRRTRSRGPHTACTQGNLQSALTTQKWVTSPWCTPSPLANSAVQAIRVGHPCFACKNRSTSPAGPYPPSEAPARRPPEGSPGQWSFNFPRCPRWPPAPWAPHPGAKCPSKCPCTGQSSSGLPAKLAPPPASADDGVAKPGPQAPGPSDVLPFKRPGHLPVDSGGSPCTGEGTLVHPSPSHTTLNFGRKVLGVHPDTGSPCAPSERFGGEHP